MKMKRTQYELYAHGDVTHVRRIYEDEKGEQWIKFEGEWHKVDDITDACDRQGVYWIKLFG